MHKSITSVTAILILATTPYASADDAVVTGNSLQLANSFSQRLNDSVLPGLNKPKNAVYTSTHAPTHHDRYAFETNNESLNDQKSNNRLDSLPVVVTAPNLLRLSF